MISFEKKFIFIHIPKTAGTSIEKTIEDKSCIFKRNQWSDKPLGFNAPLNHLTINQVEVSKKIKRTDIETFFKFTFVRNPWDRVISECFCSHIQLIFKDCKSINDKIRVVCSLAEKGYGGHCKKQVHFTTSSNYTMDYVGRYENLVNDFNCICKQLGIEQKDLPQTNKSKRVSYKDYFNQEMIDLVARTYSDDINNFNYDF